MKSPIRCYWHHEGQLKRTDLALDPDAEHPFETYGEIVSFVKSNLSVNDETRKFAVMAVVDKV